MATNAPRAVIVTETADYRIVRVGPGDFDCFVTGTGYIGSTASQLAAQSLINEYRYNTMTRAPEPAALTETPAPERVLTAQYGSGVIIGGGDQDVIVKLDTATDFGSQTVWQARSELTPEPLTTAQAAAQHLANVIQAPTYVVEQNGAYLIQDDTDLSIYFADVHPAAIVASFQPEPPRAVSLQSIAIDQAAQRNRICPNCQGAHWGWQCPQIAAALFAPPTPATWKDIALGRELCRMRWRDFTAFVALLLSVPADHLVIYAASYQAFVQSYGPSDLAISDILQVWGRLMRDNRSDPGPAAPALTMRAAA